MPATATRTAEMQPAMPRDPSRGALSIDPEARAALTRPGIEARVAMRLSASVHDDPADVARALKALP